MIFRTRESKIAMNFMIFRLVCISWTYNLVNEAIFFEEFKNFCFAAVMHNSNSWTIKRFEIVTTFCNKVMT